MSDEYVRKQDAIDAIRKAENHAFNSFYKGLVKAHEIVADLSPADVVPVVRCRDCKHVRKWRSEESAKKFGQIYECARGVLACPDPNDFCSYGERKE